MRELNVYIHNIMVKYIIYINIKVTHVETSEVNKFIITFNETSEKYKFLPIDTLLLTTQEF